MRTITVLVMGILLLLQGQAFCQSEMVGIKGGEFVPLYGTKDPVYVNNFKMDVYPVTIKEFQRFLRLNPHWKRSQIKTLFADESYLINWKDDERYSGTQNPDSPVTHISWYAAKNYCECQGKRLPTVEEWEYAAMASKTKPDARKDAAFNQVILGWYETPNSFNNKVGSTFKNYWGVYDLHGLVWEWTLDFNSVLISGESRNDSTGDNNLFCGASGVGSSDLMNYAAFMRYAFRGSVKARYSIKNLGFRCVKEMTPSPI